MPIFGLMIRDYYNEWVHRQVRDMLFNERQKLAIAWAGRQIPKDATRVLDLGVGIGWSSWEFSRLGLEVTGVDISDRMIECGRELFPGLVLSSLDLRDCWPQGEYDVIIMLDVFEHLDFPIRDRIVRSLSPRGRLIISCPTQLHQQWLKRHNPSGLQPVDREVGLDDMLELGGVVTTYAYQSVFTPNDYFYCVIDWSVEYGRELHSEFRLSSLLSRVWRLRSRLKWGDWKYLAKKITFR